MNALAKARKRTQADVDALTARIDDWPRLRETNERISRFVEAYLMMALRGAYRPAAPSDGFGHIVGLSREQLADDERLANEALKYAVALDKEEDTLSFRIGCSNFPTNRVFVLALEAARLCCGGLDGAPHALQLLKLATEEVTRVINER